MALSNPSQTLETGVDSRSPEEESESEPEQELEDLETQVKHMAQKILEYRSSIPDQVKTTFASVISAQRPVLPNIEPGSDPGPSSHRNPDSGGQVESSRGALLTDEEQKTAEKIRLLKDKISNNVSAMPVVLKRMKECISSIDKLDSYNGIIHPAFKKKKTS